MSFLVFFLLLWCVDSLTSSSPKFSKKVSAVQLSSQPSYIPLRYLTKQQQLFAANEEYEFNIGGPISKSKYTDRKSALWERAAIFVLSYLLAAVSPNKEDCMKYVRLGMDFDGFVSVTKKMLQGADVATIRSIIVNLLKNLMPEKVRLFFQNKYKEAPKYLCESCSQWMTFGLLNWLVGPLERITLDIPSSTDDSSNTTNQWQSGVKLLECKYLMKSGCKATCLHLCKGPTQEFFNKELGVPLTMKPNFEDCSCEMMFGVPPPPPELDPAYGEPCFSSCSMARLEAKKLWRTQNPTTSTPADAGLLQQDVDGNKKKQSSSTICS
eukprot:gene2321-4514_t